MRITLEPDSLDDYRKFLAIKQLPRYAFEGHTAIIDDCYASMIGIEATNASSCGYVPMTADLFDYQHDIVRHAVDKRRFAVFADCGLGKTLIILEFAQHAIREMPDRKTLIISPLMVIDQTIEESERFYGQFPERIKSRDLSEWLNKPGGGYGITNYEAMREDLPDGDLACLILDESSMLKSHYGKFGRACIALGRGVPYKLACTGTPAPNDRIEYANHAVFLDRFPTVNAFLARYFVNRGQVDGRWELKPHAVDAFYRQLADWSIFLSQPSRYGWRANTEQLPPIKVNVHNVELSKCQRDAMQADLGILFAGALGGIETRGKASQLAKGFRNGKKIKTNKTGFIRDLVESWPDESTIIWCRYNAEQDAMAQAFPGAASISGDTPHQDRLRMIADFKAGRVRVLISKPKILGFGLNLQIATRMVFSGLQDSYEEFYQAVKRANRFGSKHPLNVHIPVTELEAPMVDNVLRKAHRVQLDAEEQERIFSNAWK